MDDRPPRFQGPVVMDQVWADLLFLHWRVDAARVAPHLPPGCRPDEHDGSSWIGLIGFEMRDAGFGLGHPIPFFGTFGEINVRLYSTDDEGRRGVVFRSLETERLALVAAADPVGVRYRWSRIAVDRAEGRLGYTSTRLAPPSRGARTRFAVRRGEGEVRDPLSVFLTARFGMHHRLGRRPLWIPNTHEPWPLRTAELLECDDELVAAAGFPGITDGPPESVLWSPGVRTQFGPPRLHPAPPSGHDRAAVR
ncbi:MAG: hypothetical protein JWR20_2671 [Marmoricola sp.]|nr:hypothetical protein [Marmoricola sp.]